MILKKWNFYNPVRIINSTINSLAMHIKQENILVITTKGSVKRGILNLLVKILDGKNITVCDAVEPNPDLNFLQKKSRKYSLINIDCIIAIGGGSVIDVAKVLTFSLSNPDIISLKEQVECQNNVNWQKKINLIAIPTTSGTGSEVTPFATVWDYSNKKKYSLSNDSLYPDIALLDKNLTTSLNFHNTLYPALDTISHSLESIWNINSNPITENYAQKSLSISKKYLPILLKDLNNIDAREQMQLASLYSGIAISHTKTALAHSISYPLTLYHKVPHGLACSFLLPNLIDLYLKDNPKTDLRDLFQEISLFLKSLNLYDYLKEYLDKVELIKLTDLMISSDRAKNFSIPSPDLKKIIERI